MFSDLKLLYLAPRLLEALREVAGDVFFEKVWVNSSLKTVQVSLVFQGKRYDTWGTDKNEALALAKSLMEMIERLHADRTPAGWDSANPLIHQFMSTTSGCAAHLCHDLAFKASRAELIERHQLLKAFLLSEPPQISTKTHFVWKSVNQSQVALAYKKLPEGGYIFGSGAAQSVSDACKKASFEISGVDAWAGNSRNVEYLKENFKNNSPSRIHAYHLSLDSLPDFLYKTVPGIDSNVEIQSNTVSLLAPFAAIPGLTVVRSYSKFLQPFSFLSHSEMEINPLAIPIDKIHSELEYNVVA